MESIDTMTLFKLGDFVSHSGKPLRYKIECDTLTDDDLECIAYIIASETSFSSVVGVPTGGCRLAEALRPYSIAFSQYTLLVDDVMTTGASMEEMKTTLSSDIDEDNIDGWVIFSETDNPYWIRSVFSSAQRKYGRLNEID